MLFEDTIRIFKEICAVPHGSSHTDKIADFVCDFAEENGLKHSRDIYNNIVIEKNGTKGYENHQSVIIQGHLDMVCEKEENVEINFLTDGLSLETEGDFLFAKGTTLGADDGIAVAYALAILINKEISHPPLEVILTVDEEIGMLGASAFDAKNIKGKTMLNIDSETEGEILTSCAGGETNSITIPFEKENTRGILYTARLFGLKGGHSGTEIDKGNLNAVKIMAEILNKSEIKLVSINGGNKDNAIPRECCASFFADDFDFDLEKYKILEPNIKFSLSKKEGVASAMTKKSSKNILSFLNEVPNGVQKKNGEFVETSLNLGILETEDDFICSVFSVRSSVNKKKAELSKKVSAIAKEHNGFFEISGEYPAWEEQKGSKLQSALKKCFFEQYQKEPKFMSIHAGVECGIFCGKIKDLDAVSFGPNIFDIHTTREKISLSSVERTAKFIQSVLENL